MNPFACLNARGGQRLAGGKSFVVRALRAIQPRMGAAAPALWLAGAMAGAGCLAQELTLVGSKPGGVYQTGERIQWRASVQPGATNAPTELRYTLKKGGLTVLRQGRLPLTNGSAVLEAVLDEPGTILAEVSTGARGVRPVLAGAVAAPERIKPSAAAPQDFDVFWSAQIERLGKIPARPALERGESGKAGVEYYKLQMDNINGSHVYGQLARPEGQGPFPAMLIVQWAGVYGLPKGNVVNDAQKGWLVLNIMAHDLPFDQPEEFYKKAADGPLNNYVALGNTNRETSYFLRMYLGCYRAAEYLAGRPDWDGRTLVVTGTSQGGLQSIVTAAIHPKISALIANVPAGCDRTGPWAGRSAGWPGWPGDSAYGKGITEVNRYFDVVNFAPRVKCPAVVALGLIDTTCPPAGVLAAVNQFQGPKEVVVMPVSGHQEVKGSQSRYYARSGAWKAALRQGRPVPPPEKE